MYHIRITVGYVVEDRQRIASWNIDWDGGEHSDGDPMGTSREGHDR